MNEIKVAKDDCPVAPPPLVTVYTRVLHRACQTLGGLAQLALHLRVTEAVLYRWLEGEDIPPSNIFLKAVDVVLPAWGPEDDVAARELFGKKPKDN